MNRTPRRPDDERERNLPGMPPAEDRQRPGALEKNRTAWTRGDGGMEGPSGWHSEFGRAGFASTGERLNDAPQRGNPLDGASPAPPPATAGADRPAITPAATSTPEQEKIAKEAGPAERSGAQGPPRATP